jgi:4-carboxymuconolactone decarboxylase
MTTSDDVRAVAPALEKYAQGRLFGEVWKRPDLSPRDRSIVTLAALIARNQTAEMQYHVNLALDNGVKPGEISEIITHLAFYSGWGNAMTAVGVAKDIFTTRNIKADQLPPASEKLLPLDEAAEAKRADQVEQDFGKVSPGVVQYTGEVLFRDLWLRPGLAPRDRSLGDRQRADRLGPGRTNPVSPESRHGQRPDESASLRDAYPSGFLRRLA